MIKAIRGMKRVDIENVLIRDDEGTKGDVTINEGIRCLNDGKKFSFVKRVLNAEIARRWKSRKRGIDMNSKGSLIKEDKKTRCR